ncbi:MAG: penicillin-binding protein 2 [bacterium]|nr:penicillin-binding protein 2 [bacterium]
MAQAGRIKVIGGIVLCVAIMIGVRLYYLQVMRSDDYRSQADRQYVRHGTGLFDRGSIYFSPRKGEPISAATLKSGYTITINPRQIEHPEDVVNGLTGIVDIGEGALIAVMANPTAPSREVDKRVSEEDRTRVAALRLKGVDIVSERWRDYPAGVSAANVLGFVGYGEDDRTLSGRYGLERYYESVLSRDSSNLYVNFFAQIFSNAANFIIGGNAEGDIVTTIEPSVQIELERKLAGVVKSWNSDVTGGIIMDPKTGQIFAMAATPSFDPNDFSKAKDSSVYGNPLVDRVYEMGSIIKPFGIAAALDAGAITARTTYDDTGTMVVNGSRISNYDGKARGTVDMQAVLNQSLNIGMAFITKRLGNDALKEYFLSFGFGEETGVDLPGEVRGLVSNLGKPRDLEHITASYGQGIALTPIATVRALSALGNGGYLPEPHIVKEVRYATGQNKIMAYDGTKNRVLKPETSEEITRMLVRVVDEALLGGSVKQTNYSIAAKTGTAQMANPAGGGYYQDRYLHSFFGYFPAYEPRFIVFLYTVYPKGASYASHTLTQPFIDLTKFLINYYEVPPDR